MPPVRHTAARGAGYPGPVSDAPYRPGDAADFDRLYRASYRRVLYTLTAVLRDAAAAEDCAQETYVRALRAWPRWRPDAPAEAWVHSIAVRVASSHRRHERLREVGEILRRVGRPQAVQADEPVPGGALLDALRALPPQQAAVVVLRHHHGYSNREIAAALRLPESTVASRLAAAKQRLRAELVPGTEASAERDHRRRRQGVVNRASSGVSLSERPAAVGDR